MTGAGVSGSGAITNNSGGSQAILAVNQSGNSTYSGVVGGPADGSAPDRNIALSNWRGYLYASAEHVQRRYDAHRRHAEAGAVNAIPSGAGKGNVGFNPAGGNTAILDIAGFSPTFNGLSNSGSGSSTVDNSVAGGPYTLTVGANDATSTFSGAIKNTSGAVNLVKTGTGTLTLSDANAYAGATTISNGTLIAAGGRVFRISDVTIASGATFSLSEGAALGVVTETIGGLSGAGSVTTTDPMELVVTGGGNYAGAMSGLASLIVAGEGTTLTFTGSFGGHGILHAGNGATLVFNGTSPGGAEVYPSGTLAGTGTINGIDVKGGTLAPGASGPGVLHSDNFVTFEYRSTFNVDLHGTTVGTQYGQLTADLLTSAMASVSTSHLGSHRPLGTRLRSSRATP